MYPVAVVGDNPTARAAILACRRSGFTDVTWVKQADVPTGTASTLPANLSRIVSALGRADALDRDAYAPDREQVRFAASAYLLSELPLGKFSRDRYGAEHTNIENTALAAVLDPGLNPESSASIASLEKQHALVLVCETQTAEPAAATHALWHARLAPDEGMAKANITWLAAQQTAWQFATTTHMHVLFSTPLEIELLSGDWHPTLHAALEQASFVEQFNAYDKDVREHWYAGNVVYLGEACYKANPYRREASALGLEDAWVLSRMMENYEEDISDGLVEYQKYRRPRARKVAATAAQTAAAYNLNAPLKRTLRNVSLAFGTRFMPEIAMQRIDWLYNYDCIRGFR